MLYEVITGAVGGESGERFRASPGRGGTDRPDRVGGRTPQTGELYRRSRPRCAGRI